MEPYLNYILFCFCTHSHQQFLSIDNVVHTAAHLYDDHILLIT